MTSKLRAEISQHVPEIITKLAKQAKAGDVGAARLLLERACPAVKPIEQSEAIDLTGDTLSEQGRSAIAALASGQLAPAQAAQFMTALAGLAKLIETDELERRIAALEQSRDTN